MAIGKCSGIHTRYVASVDYTCVECEQSLHAESGPAPLYCPTCATELGSCWQCGRELEADSE